MIVVSVLAVLSPILGSFSCPVTVAVLVIVPAGVAGSTVTVMVTVALAPFARLPKAHVTTPPASIQPGLEVVKGHANWQRISNGYSSSIGWTIVGHGQGVCQIATRCYWIR